MNYELTSNLIKLKLEDEQEELERSFALERNLIDKEIEELLDKEYSYN